MPKLWPDCPHLSSCEREGEGSGTATAVNARARSSSAQDTIWAGIVPTQMTENKAGACFPAAVALALFARSGHEKHLPVQASGK